MDAERYLEAIATAASALNRRASGTSADAAGALVGALLARAASGMAARRRTGGRAGREAVTVHKTISIAAPVDEVWRFWSRVERFPRFMAHLDSVRGTGDRRSHGVGRGAAGTRFEWDVDVTRRDPEAAIAWRSVSGATVVSAGIVRFQPEGENRTRIDVRLSYDPAAGASGQLMAALLSSDPGEAMDEAMVHLEWLLDRRNASVSGKRVTRADADGEEVSKPAEPGR